MFFFLPKNLKLFFVVFTLFVAFELHAVEPAPMKNFFPVVIVNNTGQADSNIFFIGHGNDEDGFPGFLVPDGSGVVSFVYPDVAGTIGSANQSKSLDQLPVATNIPTIPAGASARLIYVPIDVSSRAYFSIQQPIYLITNLNSLGLLAIDDPSVTSRRDPNFLTFYQDFEFGLISSTVDSSTQLFLTLSYVDYFCLPMQLRTFSYPSNDPIIVKTSPTAITAIPSGTEDNKSREQIISAVKTGLSNGEVSGNPSWQYLDSIYYPDPYNSSSMGSTLRILAAKSSIALGASNTGFNGGHSVMYFPDTYLSSTTKGPSSVTSYLEAVYDHYKTGTNPPLYVHIFPGKPPGGGPAPNPVTYGISSTETDLELLFTIKSGDTGPTGFTVNLGDIPPDKFWSGATWPFVGSPTPSTLYSDELSKALSSLFTVGKLPLDGTTENNPFVNNNEGFSVFTYFTEAPFSGTGLWSNLYCEVFHEQFLSKNEVPSNPAYGLAYAFDYDDLLNMSGIINGLFFQDQYGTPSTMTAGEPASEPFLMISLESLSGSAIPNIRNESYNYSNIIVGAAAQGVKVTYRYNGGSGNVVAPTSGTSPLTGLSVTPANPLLVDFEFDGNTYTFFINVKQQIALPESTTDPFNVIRSFFQQGITFTRLSPPGADTDPNVQINVNSSPPPHPG